MSITRDDVLCGAHLARIELTSEETERFGRNLERILEYIDQLREVDITDLQPQTQFAGHRNFFREDRVRPSLSRDEALANAPDQKNGMFRVPRVFG